MYKNKNLIYVNGKPYREQDLQDMIDYYRQTYKHDIHLPANWHEDVSGQIFKNYPFYPAISKATYRPELYYEQNCQLDITFKEFVDYVTEENPSTYAIMFLQKYNDIGVVSRLAYINKNDDDTYTYKDFYINAEDGVDIGDDYVASYNDILEMVIAEFEGNIKGREIWYDLSTVVTIFERRKQCQQFNKSYALDMTGKYVKQFLSNIPKITDKNTFIMYYSYYLYIVYSILANNADPSVHDAIINHINDFIDLLDNGIPDDVNEMNTLLEDYVIQNIISIDKQTSKVNMVLNV
jgi:hypothetical protein